MNLNFEITKQEREEVDAKLGIKKRLVLEY
jgi:hypothetical protein